jgi:hypothetical protein
MEEIYLYKEALRCKAKHLSYLQEKLRHTDRFKPGNHEISQLYLNLQSRIQQVTADIIRIKQHHESCIHPGAA